MQTLCKLEKFYKNVGIMITPKKYFCDLLGYLKLRNSQGLEMVAPTDRFRIFLHALRCLQI